MVSVLSLLYNVRVSLTILGEQVVFVTIATVILTNGLKADSLEGFQGLGPVKVVHGLYKSRTP